MQNLVSFAASGSYVPCPVTWVVHPRQKSSVWFSGSQTASALHSKSQCCGRKHEMRTSGVCLMEMSETWQNTNPSDMLSDGVACICSSAWHVHLRCGSALRRGCCRSVCPQPCHSLSLLLQDYKNKVQVAVCCGSG